MWAIRPHLGSIFVKLLHRKTFQNSTAFSVKIFRCNCSTGTVTNYLFTAPVHKAGRSCSPRLEKLSLFSPSPPCAKSMAREFRCLRAAIRATRPHLANIFEKLLDQKTFISPAACFRKANCIRFGKIALLFAFVLFAGGCVVRIVYESFLDFGLSEFFMLSEWRTAFTHFS